jgi:DNA-binding NarL/FixJ family response regulator
VQRRKSGGHPRSREVRILFEELHDTSGIADTASFEELEVRALPANDLQDFVVRGHDETRNEILSRLTDREREVLRLMAAGYSNREIATTLETAEGTVKNQVSSILSKFGVRDRTRAVLKAIEAGLLWES